MGKILVADDQESMRFIITNLLTEAGHTVETAEDGAQALAKVRQNDYDLVVADVNMPKLDGLEFLKQARQSKPQVKVVFVTGMLEDTVRIGSENIKFSGLILKPFEKPVALEIIEKALAS